MSESFWVKKGPADPFRGDWYLEGESFSEKDTAIRHAANLSLENYRELSSGWEQYGYEWSVFRNENGTEKKIWEGFKFIMELNKTGTKEVNFNLGYLGE